MKRLSAVLKEDFLVPDHIDTNAGFFYARKRSARLAYTDDE